MPEVTAVHQLLDAAADRRPGHVALEDAQSDGRMTYQALRRLSEQVRDRLAQMGVGRGDRVGICMQKSIDAIASIYGTMKAGAAYVPVDSTAPMARNAFIFGNCALKAMIVESRFRDSLTDEMDTPEKPATLSVDGPGDGSALEASLTEAQNRDPAQGGADVAVDLDDLAYILYTSGSTGRPKGVMLSHRNALSFIDWCTETFEPNEDDRFSSHAPLHFDLSILDLYLAAKHAASIVLIGHESSKEPARLAALIADRRITRWYSAPSILSLLVRYGKLEEHDYSALRAVVFAGEVFPVRYLRQLKELIPHPRYFNLYGPTETNVCTYYEIPESVPPDRTDPYPIGKVCSHLQARVIDSDARDVPAGDQGELCISGPGVMQGYWDLPEQTEKAFVVGSDGRRWYRTGDLVVENGEQEFIYHGRLDRMVKKRGFRVELGEIEACLYGNPSVRHAAVIAVPDEDEGVRIKAFVSVQEDAKRSIIAFKRYCSERLPLYMVPDVLSFMDELPLTSTDKVDYQALKELD